MAAVTLRGLTKEFPGGVRALDALDLSIVDGEFFALLGPSGCGKTTLLRTIAGLEAPSAGEVRIGDRTVTALPPGARNVAMVFQDYALFPHMTVVDNIAYPLRIRRQPRPERTAHAREVGGQLSYRAGSSSASPWPEPWPANRPSSCSTSHCLTWTLGCGWRLARSSNGCSATSRSPPCSSPTTRPKRSRSPTGSPSWRPAGSASSARRARSSCGRRTPS